MYLEHSTLESLDQDDPVIDLGADELATFGWSGELGETVTVQVTEGEVRELVCQVTSYTSCAELVLVRVMSFTREHHLLPGEFEHVVIGQA